MSSLCFVAPLAERVLNSIPEGLLLAAFAWLLLKVVPRQNSGTRFAVWFVSLLAIVALPFIHFFGGAGTVSRAVHAEITLPGTWAVGIAAVWSLMVLIGAARLALGFVHLRTLRKQASSIKPESLDSKVAATVKECRAVRSFELLSSEEVRVPAAIGFLSPAIIVPAWALRELSADELRSIVLHEFAHLRRWDDWTNLAQKFVRALFFFHPAVLWIERRLTLEREMACDDVVLSQTQDPGAYARCLVSLAEKSFVRRTMAMAQAAIGRAHETTLRLAQILDVDRPKATRVFKPVLAVVAGVAAVVGAFAVPNAPRLIAFHDAAPESSQFAALVASDETIPELPKSMVVPAAVHIERPAPAKLVPAKHVARRKPGKPQPLLAKQIAPAKEEQLIQASTQERTPAPQYLVITQSTDYYQEGAAFVTYSVWRVTLVKAREHAAQTSKAPNQT